MQTKPLLCRREQILLAGSLLRMSRYKQDARLEAAIDHLALKLGFGGTLSRMRRLRLRLGEPLVEASIVLDLREQLNGAGS